jgi:hypothetical protein
MLVPPYRKIPFSGLGRWLMKHVLMFLVTCATLVAPAQQPSQPASQIVASSAAANSAVPEGIMLSVRLNNAVSSMSAKVGDAVNLELLKDVKGQDKQVLIPRKAKLSARVVAAQAYTKETESRLAIHVDKAEWEGHSVPLNGVLSRKPRLRVRPAPWAGPGGPIGTTIIGEGMPYHGPTYTPTDPGNEPEFLDFKEMEGVEIRDSSDSHIVKVLVSKADNINLDKGALLDIENATIQDGRESHPTPRP